MTKKIGTMAEWQKALDDLSIVPEGFITARQYSEAPETRCHVTTARPRLRRLVLAGKVECREFNRIQHYRLIHK